ncbi:MAG TPA: hypothetical protein V6C89_04710 [Drouetiella sp.]|jgi:hypothetical protein
MGVLCEVYIADRKRFKQYNFRDECNCKNLYRCKCWDEFAAETYDHIDNHRVYDRNFAQLLSVLRGKKHRDSVLKEFKLLENSEEGPWIQKVPADLPKLLAQATVEDLKTIADAWCKLIDDVGEGPVEKKLFLDYLRKFQKLCKKAITKKQDMYLWTSL